MKGTSQRRSKNGSSSLRAIVSPTKPSLSSSRSFLEQVHTKGLNQLHQLLEGEQWVAVEVPPSIQAIADRMVAKCAAANDYNSSPTPSPTASPSKVVMTMPLPTSSSVPHREDSGGASSNGPPRLPASDSAPLPPPVPSASAQLQLLGRGFPVVTSSLILLKLLDEYLVLQVRMGISFCVERIELSFDTCFSKT